MTFNPHHSYSPTIRFLSSDDLERYRTLRLQALQESSTAFGSSYEEETAFSREKFLERLQRDGDPANGIFGAFVMGELVGILGFSKNLGIKRRHIAALWSVYVRPEFRSQGIGAALLDASISHAHSIPGLRQITLSVTASNPAACALYRSRGFQHFGLEKDALWVDGKFYDFEHMVLFLSS